MPGEWFCDIYFLQKRKRRGKFVSTCICVWGRPTMGVRTVRVSGGRKGTDEKGERCWSNRNSEAEFFVFLIALTHFWLWVAEVLLLWVLIFKSRVIHREMTNKCLLGTRLIAEEDFFWLMAFVYAEKVSMASSHGHWAQFLDLQWRLVLPTHYSVRAGSSILLLLYW